MKRYRIAGLTVEMAVAGRTQRQAEPYATDSREHADIRLELDIKRVLEHNPTVTSEDVAQYLGTGALFSRRLLDFDGSFLHASAVIWQGRAYLFSAPSGTGKSTHTEKWCRLFGARYLNDDKPVLRLVDGKWLAYGTPWSGKHDLSSPEGAPVGGIAFLERGEENAICPLTGEQALPLFMSQSLWRLGREDMEKQLALIDRLLPCVPLWQLTCRNDDAAAHMSHAAMTNLTG